ncbi:deoxyribodipyrimidine photo-lyase [Ammoniphilus sp. CFH 90114]|uniref:cryptochrome/photolyase family protein n=1 Tax=Ammoniphilus sp. CFH 90114 TaxID=2493665 RepID=UPI00100FBFBA|nr:deoxyribodipyrimidine photo-lyase [Ammoniphilus sp. CFH 90114]RXT07977.1 deoxyribodipyrimidine photo-lyase [Ammoniphilus sp. CFH 90114]
MKEKTTIVWFRRDLRIHDNPALWEAVQRGVVLPVFIWEDCMSEQATSWWLHQSLAQLEQTLQKLGSRLILRQGSSLVVLKEILRETNADALYFTQRYEPTISDEDKQIKQALREYVEVRSFHAHLLFEPNSILTQQQQPYKVFTPFWKQSRRRDVTVPLPSPGKIPTFQGNVETVSLEELGLLPKVKWYNKFSSYWTPGENGAMLRWKEFAEGRLDGYSTKRDFPFSSHASGLSPHLAWGELSPRWIWHNLKEISDISENQEHVEAFLRQLVWRDFAYCQLQYFPRITNSPLRAEFLSFPWEEDEEAFKQWKQGQTGYPFVDAGMRELWETGWMHNRVRMIASSFLVKHLLIPWKKGANWFEETLLDMDIANNTMGWQWVAGCGFDASPYFRVFNPITQGEKFDRNGDYIRRWVPELEGLPSEYIHRPWTAPQQVLQAAGIELGNTYPLPIIDHLYARERALNAYQMIKK